MVALCNGEGCGDGGLRSWWDFMGGGFCWWRGRGIRWWWVTVVVRFSGGIMAVVTSWVGTF